MKENQRGKEDLYSGQRNEKGKRREEKLEEKGSKKPRVIDKGKKVDKRKSER